MSWGMVAMAGATLVSSILGATTGKGGKSKQVQAPEAWDPGGGVPDEGSLGDRFAGVEGMGGAAGGGADWMGMMSKLPGLMGSMGGGGAITGLPEGGSQIVPVPTHNYAQGDQPLPSQDALLEMMGKRRRRSLRDTMLE